MIVGIEGFMGDGKTIYMVRNALIDWLNQRKIYANFGLRGIDYSPLIVTDFLNTKTAAKYKNASLFIDEITLFMDCRRSSRKENVAISTLLRQSRKRSICIYYSAQSLDELDLRLLRYTSLFVIAERVYRADKNGVMKEAEDYRQYTIIDTRQRKENTTHILLKITPYYKYYDTDEIIESIYETKQKKT